MKSFCKLLNSLSLSTLYMSQYPKHLSHQGEKSIDIYLKAFGKDDIKFTLIIVNQFTVNIQSSTSFTFKNEFGYLITAPINMTITICNQNEIMSINNHNTFLSIEPISYKLKELLSSNMYNYKLVYNAKENQFLLTEETHINTILKHNTLQYLIIYNQIYITEKYPQIS